MVSRHEMMRSSEEDTIEDVEKTENDTVLEFENAASISSSKTILRWDTLIASAAYHLSDEIR